MRQICFFKVTGCQRPKTDDPSNGEQPLRIDESAAMQSPFGLWIEADGRLRATPLADQGNGEVAAQNGAALVAALRCLGEDNTPAWYAAVRSPRLGINGTTPPLPLVRLEPGALLSVDRDFWLVSTVWRPKPGPAPPEVADSPCPVCGAKLREYPVVQCPGPNCGRWTHLERPDEPDSEEYFNCYLATGNACPDCHHLATLDPIMVPEPHDKLLPAVDDDPDPDLLC